jgi:DNA-binding CsgD family transcriptional regulator
MTAVTSPPGDPGPAEGRRRPGPERARRMRGRGREWGIVLGLLKAAGAGRPGILLIEGEPGVGKSLLLGEAAREAASRGLTSMSGAARELGPMAPVEPLLRLLGEPPVAEESSPPLGVVERLRTNLEKRAGAGPVLVSVDDLQWADSTTLTALRMLTWHLGCHPVAWLLARRSTGHDGAVRRALGPLEDDAPAEIVIDLLGTLPDPDLLALAAGAGGNPYLLTELLTGLRDEGAVRIRDGRARLSSTRLPVRVRAAVRRRLGALQPGTRHLLTVGAMLGHSFAPEDVAEMLGTTPAAIVPDLDEALNAGVLAAGPDSLRFRHGLIWQVIVEAVPPPVRRALHRQIGELLIGRDGTAASAAFHLVRGTRPGDGRALAGIDRVIATVLPTSPQSAVELAVHALEVTDPDDHDRPARTLTAVRALTAAGRLEEATRLARMGFTRPMPALCCARLHCLLSEILHLRGRPDEAAEEAATALAEPRLPDGLRDDAELALLNAQAGDGAQVRERAEAIVSAASDHGDALVTGAFTALALAEWDAGRLSAGLAFAYEAVRRATSTAARRIHPRLILAMLLTDAQRFDEARTVMASAGDDCDALGHLAGAAAPAIFRARLHLAAGRLRAAVTEAEAALVDGGGLGPHPLTSAASTVLAGAALRAGDVNAAQRHVRHATRLPSPSGSPYGQVAFELVTAQITEAREGAAALADSFGPLCEQVLRHRWVLIADPAAAAWLVRTARILDQRPRAELVVAAAERLAGDNPAFAAAGAAAAHARGLLDASPAPLEHAASQHSVPWARASAAEDLALLIAVEGTADARRRAVVAFDGALSAYDAMGAARDAARVRRRLRRLGVRRRHWSQADRPVSGWASLTDTERTVSELVAQGLTNRQVADQLFMSVHTVAFHLRHVFRKLDVTSRVELTRLILQQSA